MILGLYDILRVLVPSKSMNVLLNESLYVWICCSLVHLICLLYIFCSLFVVFPWVYTMFSWFHSLVLSIFVGNSFAWFRLSTYLFARDTSHWWNKRVKIIVSFRVKSRHRRNHAVGCQWPTSNGPISPCERGSPVCLESPTLLWLLLMMFFFPFSDSSLQMLRHLPFSTEHEASNSLRIWLKQSQEPWSLIVFHEMHRPALYFGLGFRRNPWKSINFWWKITDSGSFWHCSGTESIASLAEGHAWLKRRASLDVVTAVQPMFRTTKSVCEMAHCDPLCWHVQWQERTWIFSNASSLIKGNRRRNWKLSSSWQVKVNLTYRIIATIIPAQLSLFPLSCDWTAIKLGHLWGETQHQHCGVGEPAPTPPPPRCQCVRASGPCVQLPQGARQCDWWSIPRKRPAFAWFGAWFRARWTASDQTQCGEMPGRKSLFQAVDLLNSDIHPVRSWFVQGRVDARMIVLVFKLWSFIRFLFPAHVAFLRFGSQLRHEIPWRLDISLQQSTSKCALNFQIRLGLISCLGRFPWQTSCLFFKQVDSTYWTAFVARIPQR